MHARRGVHVHHLVQRAARAFARRGVGGFCRLGGRIAAGKVNKLQHPLQILLQQRRAKCIQQRIHHLQVEDRAPLQLAHRDVFRRHVGLHLRLHTSVAVQGRQEQRPAEVLPLRAAEQGGKPRRLHGQVERLRQLLMRRRIRGVVIFVGKAASEAAAATRMPC